VSTPSDFEVDVTDIVNALTAARLQSLEDVLADIERFDPLEAMTAFHDAALPKMSFDPVVAALRPLPELANLGGLADHVFRQRARILTEHGTLIYAFALDPLDRIRALLTGIHCFPAEDCVGKRPNSFVLLDFDGVAAMVQADVYEQAMDPASSGDIYVLHVYDVLIEGGGATGA
jgi:hypothetical protein